MDKSLREHSLLHAIARVNRVYKGKDFALIVDYWGILGKLKSAIDMYDDAESEMNKFDPNDIQDANITKIERDAIVNIANEPNCIPY